MQVEEVCARRNLPTPPQPTHTNDFSTLKPTVFSTLKHIIFARALPRRDRNPPRNGWDGGGRVVVGAWRIVEHVFGVVFYRVDFLTKTSHLLSLALLISTSHTPTPAGTKFRPGSVNVLRQDQRRSRRARSSRLAFSSKAGGQHVLSRDCRTHRSRTPAAAAVTGGATADRARTRCLSAPLSSRDRRERRLNPSAPRRAFFLPDLGIKKMMWLEHDVIIFLIVMSRCGVAISPINLPW